MQYVKSNEEKKLALQPRNDTSIVDLLTGENALKNHESKIEIRKQTRRLASRAISQMDMDIHNRKGVLQIPVDSYGQTFKFVEQAEENQRKKKLLQKSVGSDVAL